ncbi:MAG: DUF1697 domain-containing protein [Chloroflexi bacterium]|nr:DUF1697 domain-containing protein [Chloroflexota bacterium]
MNTKYVAFLRAINVGGTKIIKMDALRRMFESLGCANVATYIQSGNVIFETESTSSLGKQIEHQIQKTFGFEVEVFLRRMDEVRVIVETSPFGQEGEETVFIHLLHAAPQAESRQALLALSTATDSFAVQGREVYWLRRDRAKSPFDNNRIEKALGLSATARNLNTLTKIVEKYG